MTFYQFSHLPFRLLLLRTLRCTSTVLSYLCLDYWIAADYIPICEWLSASSLRYWEYLVSPSPEKSAPQWDLRFRWRHWLQTRAICVPLLIPWFLVPVTPIQI